MKTTTLYAKKARKSFFVCLDCGSKQPRTNSKQRRCPVCQTVHDKEIDRIRKKTKYDEKKEKANSTEELLSKFQLITPAVTRNKFLQDYEVVSRKAVEFAFQLRMFKSDHDMTLERMARIASVYAQKYNTKITVSDLSNFSSFKTIPSEAKMTALLEMMDMTKEEL